MTTPHFSADFFDFFTDLKANNERDWFNANKPRYEASVMDPCLDFIAAMAEPIQTISLHFDAIPKKVGGSMFRIYRDTRFSKDKTPYKTNAGLHFRHNLSKTAHAPGFYLNLSLDSVFMGAGIWGPDSAALAKIRERIDKCPKDWLAITGADEIKNRFGGLREGNPLKRPPKGYDADHALIADLKKRSFIMMQDVDAKKVVQDDFLEQVTDSFKAAAPLVKFLCGALGHPF